MCSKTSQLSTFHRVPWGHPYLIKFVSRGKTWYLCRDFWPCLVLEKNERFVGLCEADCTSFSFYQGEDYKRGKIKTHNLISIFSPNRYFFLCTVDDQKILFVFRISLLSPFHPPLSCLLLYQELARARKLHLVGFAGHAASVATTHLPPSAKVATDRYRDEWLQRHCLQKQAVDQIGTTGYNFSASVLCWNSSINVTKITIFISVCFNQDSHLEDNKQVSITHISLKRSKI